MPEPHPIRVAHVIANLDVGGAQEVVRSLVPALRRAACDASVVALRDGPLREDLEREGVPVRLLRGRSRPLVSDPRAIGELWRIRNDLATILRDLDAQLVQTHLLRSLDFLLLTVARRGRPRLIWTFHNARLDLREDQLPAGDRFLRAKRWAYRAMYRHASGPTAAFVAVSKEVAASIRRDIRPARGKVVTIGNGVSTDRYARVVDRAEVRRSAGLPPDAVLTTCVAKLYEQKGHAVLLKAFARVAASDPRAHLALVGDGPLMEEIRAGIASAHLADRVSMLGVRHDVPDLLASSDIFVLPSLWEGMPMALLEAMAAGLPPIASRVSGTSEVLAGGDAGILVEPGDAGALADALGRLARDPAARTGLGEAARTRVRQRYSVEAQARAHIALYRRSLAVLRAQDEVAAT